MQPIQLGNVRITTAIEMGPQKVKPTNLLPSATEEAMAPHRSWLEPLFLAPDGSLLLTIQSYVVRTRHHTIVVDTCFGNDKQRSTPVSHMLELPFLERLAAAGAPPEQADYVLCTHLHVDHVGWNTKLENGRWVPTFPRAKYLIAKDEWAYWSTRKEGDFSYDAFKDSVAPVVEAGRAIFVDGTFEIDGEARLEPVPGHTPGQVALAITSQGKRGMLTGDLMHHAVQCAEPDWALRAEVDVDSARAKTTRRSFLQRHADTDTLVLPAHFPDPTAGRIVTRGATWRWAPHGVPAAAHTP